MSTRGDIAPENRAGSVGEKEGREGRAEPEPKTQAAGWDVERVCMWARENSVPEFQAVARREEIDGELGMLEEGRWTENRHGTVCARAKSSGRQCPAFLILFGGLGFGVWGFEVRPAFLRQMDTVGNQRA